MTKETLMFAVLVSVVWSLKPIGSSVDQKMSITVTTPSERFDDLPLSLMSVAGDSDVNNGSTPCDRHLRSTDVVDVRNPRTHKFVTSNGWTERQRPRPEINVYSRVEDLSSPPPPPTDTFYQQQRDEFYQHSRQQQQHLPPIVRTSKRIIYYATLPDVVRPPAGYTPLAGYSSPGGYSPPAGYPATSGYPPEPYPLTADFRQLDSNRNVADGLQRNRLTTYENVYNRGSSGNSGVSGGSVTSVTSKTSAVYNNNKYSEPTEFRDPFYRPNEFTSKFKSSWNEPFYKSWTSPSSWDKDLPLYSGGGGSPSSSFPWDREPLIRGEVSDRRPWENRGSSWDNNRDLSSWENRGSSWDKELVEVPLQKPNGGENFNREKYPEVAVVQSGVIDVRGGNRQQNGSPPPRFSIVDVDPKPYHHQQMPSSMRYEPPQKPMRYEAYPPMQLPSRFEQQPPPPAASYEQQQPPSSMRYEQQYRPIPPMPPAYGHEQNQNQQPTYNGYYENIKNNIKTHQFKTSWTEISTQDEVSPTHSVSIDVSVLGNSTSVQNDTRITPYTNSTNAPKLKELE